MNIMIRMVPEDRPEIHPRGEPLSSLLLLLLLLEVEVLPVFEDVEVEVIFSHFWMVVVFEISSLSIL